MSVLVQQDERARRLARTCFDAPLALEAGAGTGKTAALVARVAVWCLTGGWERARAALGEGATPERIAARALERVAMVTFTEKAAVEMEQRIAAALRALSVGGEVRGLPVAEIALADTELCARAGHLVAALDRLSVNTIHAFCATLLARHALAADLHPGFSIDADGAVVRATCAEVVAEALPRVLGERPEPAWLALVERGHGTQRVLEALGTLVGERVTPAELARDPYADRALEEFAQALAARCATLAQLLTQALPAQPVRHLEPALGLRDALADLEARLRSVRGTAELTPELHLDAKLAKRLAEYGKGEFNTTETKHLALHLAPIAQAAEGLAKELAVLPELDAELARTARAALAPLLVEVGARLAAAGVLTFADLLVRARDLLRDDPLVRRAVQREIDQLLVDEFQDTDGVQCDLVRSIALDGPREARPGLFLVGDPKQSIYGWRSADLEAYEGMLATLVEAGGARAQLSVNYRSSQRVLDEVERLVAPSMQAEPGLQPAFQPLLEGRTDAEVPQALWARGRAPVEHWSAVDPASPKTSAEAARRFEARRIAAELAELAGLGLPLERCAILLRTSTAQEIYLEALREAGVPYAVGKDKGYFRTREVVDAVALTACLLDPTDALALLTFLRSPSCGVPDAALAPLWRAGLPELAARLDGEHPEALEQALAALQRARAEAEDALDGDAAAGLERIRGWELCAESGLRALDGLRCAFARESADRAVERLRAWLCPEILEAARFPGAHRLANLEHFFESLVEALRTARGGAAGVLRELRAGLSGEREARSAAPGAAGVDAVRVLTVHAAKGLQFQALWLADLHHESRDKSSPAAAARVQMLDGTREIELFGAAVPARARLDARRARVAAAETVRLLYVAATRAEDRLVLGGLPGTAGAGNSLADLVAARAEGPPPWQQLAAAQAEHSTCELEQAGARWVLAALGEAATPPARPESAAGALAAVPDLRAARSTAAARTARPFLAPVSSSDHAEQRAARERGPDGGGTSLARDAARAVGVAVHAALEHWPVGRADAHALARATLEAELAVRVPAQDLAQAARAAHAVLDAFAASDLARRLDALAARFHVRELALVLPASGDEGPTAAWVGSADLVYEEGDGLVLVDFKTDRDASDAALIESYRPQLARYAEALSSALGRPALRAELWLVGDGRALALPLC